MSNSPFVVIINNQIMPYRVPLFTRLAERDNIRPHVLYCAHSASDRQWSLEHFEMPYSHQILSGFSIRQAKRLYGEQRTIWFNPTLLFTLMRLKPQVIIGYEYSVPAITALLYSRLSGCKYITWSEMTAHTERHLSRGQHITRQLIYPRSDAFIVTSNAAHHNLVDNGINPERVIVAAQPVHVEWYQQQAAALRPAHADHPPTILYVGYVNERKGVRHLIEAFEVVCRRIPEVILKIVGTGDLLNEMNVLTQHFGIAHQVQFLGFIEPGDLPPVYASADVFVLPSLEDTFGVVATEALASGLSLVCSTHAGVSSHLHDGHDAFVIEPTDHQMLAARLVTLLTDETLSAEFKHNSRAILQDFVPDFVASQFEHAIGIALYEIVKGHP